MLLLLSLVSPLLLAALMAVAVSIERDLEEPLPEQPRQQPLQPTPVGRTPAMPYPDDSMLAAQPLAVEATVRRLPDPLRHRSTITHPRSGSIEAKVTR